MATASAKNTCEEHQICCITLNMTDRLRLISCSPELTQQIRTTITTNWEHIQHERWYHGAYEFKLKGNPWEGQGDEAVPSRRLIVAILTTMSQQGWNLVQSSDVSKNAHDKDTLFFEKGIPDPGTFLFAVSFNREDRIRVIDAPRFMPYLKEVVKTTWSRGISSEREYHGSLELKLVGSPWVCFKDQNVESKVMLCEIISKFRSVGYKLYASVDISMGQDGSDLETWVFRHVGEHWQ